MKHYLIDTCILIWWLNGQQEKINSEVQSILLKQNIYISLTSLEEMAIKISLEKLNIDSQMFELLISYIENSKLKKISMTLNDCKLLSNMPFINNHKDPFDRMLISQAMNNNLIFITSDQKIKVYPEDTYYQNKLNILFN